MTYLIFLCFCSHEVEKFARNTGLKLFRTSVKENLNIGRVFQHLAERHIESVSRWSDESADEFSQPILQIGRHQSQTRDVRVRFANEHELNDDHPKGIALYHRGFKPNGYSNGSSVPTNGSRYFRSSSNPTSHAMGFGDKIILNPFKWKQKSANNGYYAHHPRYYHQHPQHVQPHQPMLKQACRMIWSFLLLWFLLNCVIVLVQSMVFGGQTTYPLPPEPIKKCDSLAVTWTLQNLSVYEVWLHIKFYHSHCEILFEKSYIHSFPVLLIIVQDKYISKNWSKLKRLSLAKV